jgi:phospholipid/cholesterol/gamma-HCH transport system permease protein
MYDSSPAPSVQRPGPPTATLITRDGAHIVALGGDWTIAHTRRALGHLAQLPRLENGPVVVDLSEIHHLDTAGAWLIYARVRDLRGADRDARMARVRPEHRDLLQTVAAAGDRCHHIPLARTPWPLAILARIGKSMAIAGEEAAALLGFLGLLVTTLLATLVQPARLRVTALVSHMEQVGLNAVPIVALISFLIGVVLAYQGAQQLRLFGAEVFVVNLVAVSVLREIGILLTAIVVAGRSGSAFTAEIGSMKLNQEVDAMRVLGLDPMQVLVVPRVLALMIMLPVLGVLSDLMGLVGGGLMAWTVLGIDPGLFIARLHETTTATQFLVGIAKAPVFALMIALVGCFQGLRVQGSSESLGRLTTRSVVVSIFLVIVVDAIFSIFFATVGI